ncbi:hypothetical protein PGLA_24270 [Paenibacillus glacialis]|uniref:Uncharacterized protein n=1 Tax=Paenibacillus glacialis TaxID=494026 RepID=A0A168DA77_9BACL|nr:hypothetical protein PGLA_24270 [Paenibacillus glacialis]
MVSGFKKLCDILLPLKTESNLIRILPYVLFSVNHIDLYEFKQINFRYLREIKYEDYSNETCRILLCLYDHIINNNNPQIEEMIISRYLERGL